MPGGTRKGRVARERANKKEIFLFEIKEKEQRFRVVLLEQTAGIEFKLALSITGVSTSFPPERIFSFQKTGRKRRNGKTNRSKRK